MCANKNHKMRQIINNLYLLFLIIMNLASFFLRQNICIYFVKNLRVYPLSPPPLLCEWRPIMTRYDFLEDGPVSWSYVWTNLNLT